MDKNQKFEVEGHVVAEMPGTKFKVKINVAGEEHEIVAYLSGKMRRFYIKILEGDFVRVEMTPYDLTQGRIVYREKVLKPGEIPAKPEVKTEDKDKKAKTTKTKKVKKTKTKSKK